MAMAITAKQRDRNLAYWSINPNDPTTEREGLWNEDGYAKIKVKITYCNQFDPVYTADE